MKEGYVAQNPVTYKVDIVKTNPFSDEDQISGRVSIMDTRLGFFAVKGIADDGWISILANYSMHYVGDWENGTITSDYFGVFSRRIKEKIGAGEDFVGMMSNGTSGDANIWDFLDPGRHPRENFAKSELIGSDLAEKVCQALVNLDWETHPALGVFYKEIPIRLRKPSADELVDWEKIVASSDYERIYEIDDVALRKIYAREQVLLHAYPDSKMIPLQAFRIGNGVIGGLGGEFFAETGLWLKKHSPATDYFTICFSNDYVGYVPPAHEIEKGGYETWQCRSSHLESDAEIIIRMELLEGIRILWNADK